MIWGIAYTVLFLALFVRFGPPPNPRPLHPGPDEPLRLIAAHHALFYVLLLAAPLEAMVFGGRSGGRLVGVVLFAVGVAGYRHAGAALGEALSPLVTPRPGAARVTNGPYRWTRHPMYLAQACIAVGAPLTLGSRWVVWLAAPALAILAVRMRLEDAALARAFPEHSHGSDDNPPIPFAH